MRRQLVLGALWVVAWLAALWAVSPALDQLDARTPQPWTVPPSAIVAIPAAPGAQWMTPSSVSASTTAGALPAPDSGYEPATASPRLPSWSAEPKPVMELGRVTMPASPTPGAAASHSLAELVRTGIASTYGPGFGEAWVAIPQGPGWRIRVCGPGACRTLVSTDKGPDQRLHPDRVVDLPIGAFEAICGVPWRMGLCSVQVVLIGRAA